MNETLADELDASFEEARRTAGERPWGHPARLPEHPETHSDRHPDDPGPQDDLFKSYF